MKALLLALWLVAAGAIAGGGLVDRSGAMLPLQETFRDESGRAAALGDYFGRVPVVLVPGYFTCPNLCSTVMDGVLEGLARAGPPAMRLLAVSIDPRETPHDARRRLDAYRPVLGGIDVHFLTGGEAGQRVAADLGFPISWDAEHAQYVHPAGFVVATPEGRIARYFLGVRFDARDLRLALTEATAGRSGSLGDRLLLFCSHYDPQTGRYSFAAMTAVRIAAMSVLAVLAGWMLRRMRR
ncbi:MAG TPA: SCO family protein [Rhodocyclaceae bacterium]